MHSPGLDSQVHSDAQIPVPGILSLQRFSSQLVVLKYHNTGGTCMCTTTKLHLYLCRLSPSPEVGGPTRGGAKGDQVPEGVGEQPGEEDHQAGGAHCQHGRLGSPTHLAASGRLIGWRGGWDWWRGGLPVSGQCFVCGNIPT